MTQPLYTIMKQFSITALIFFSLAASSQKPSLTSDTIPFIINSQNTMYVKAIFNTSDTLNLNFDTGSSDLTLTNNTLQTKLKAVPELYNTLYNLQIGTEHFKTAVYDALLAGHDTDGRFGWDLFKGKVVEINYDKNIMVIHTKLPAYAMKDKTYTRLNIRYFANVFLVESTLSQNGVKHTASFLFDSGYQRTAMLDNDLMKEGHFPADKMKVIKTVIMKGAQGNEIPVITANLEILKIGKYELQNVPVQQLTGHKPLKGTNIHILGNEVLKRFNTFLDFQNHVVYMKPNQLFHVEYIEKGS